MGKRVLLGIFAGVTLLGVILLVLGYALGGRVGSFGVQDGQWVYATRRETLQLGSAPAWAAWLENGPGPAPAAPAVPWQGSADGDSVPANADFAGLKNLDIDIDAGYVTVRVGEDVGLHVDGTMPYTANFNGSTWEIKAQHNGITTRWQDGETRFWLDGRDVTTHFTIVVPQNLQKVEAYLAMGTLTIQGLQLDEGEFKVDLAALIIGDVQAQKLHLQAELGAVEATGIVTQECDIDVSLGAVEFEGQAAQIDANCDLGSIEIRLPRPQNYTWETDCDLGSIRIDGQKRNNTEGGTPGELHLDLTCGLGSIDVEFAG